MLDRVTVARLPHRMTAPLEPGRARSRWFYLKSLVPDKLSKEAEWRKWRAQAEDYAEETFVGMK